MYKLTDTTTVIRLEDGAHIPADPGNCDWRAYQTWLAEGFTPRPADPVPTPTIYVTRLTVVDRLIAAGKLTEGLAAIAADPVVQARWNAATEIACDDPTAIALVTALGLDPAVILALPA